VTFSLGIREPEEQRLWYAAVGMLGNLSPPLQMTSERTMKVHMESLGFFHRELNLPNHIA
jgi:hypothetical protein